MVFLFSLLFSSFLAHAEPIRIGIADTGLSIDMQVFKVPLCKDGHRDYTVDPEKRNSIGIDNYGHGTHVAGLIHQRAANILLNAFGDKESTETSLKELQNHQVDYCLVIFKVIDKDVEHSDSYVNFMLDLAQPDLIKIDYLNVSLVGDRQSDIETKGVKAALKRGIVIVAAAGNSGLQIKRNYSTAFPASIPGVLAIGNYASYPTDGPPVFAEKEDLAKSGFSALPSSNYGKMVRRWMPGTWQLSNGNAGVLQTLTGTSQAAANFTGYLVNQKLQKGSKNVSKKYPRRT